MKIPYKYAVALTAALGLFMAVLDNTIVNVALPQMVTAFRTDLNATQWVITAYFLAQAAVIPAAGYLATRIGMKQVFIACLGLFTIGSLLCGLSDLVQDANGNPNIGLLIFFRVVQGIGGGALFPLATAVAFSAFPPEERAGSSAIIGVPVLMAPAFGPTIGGIITDNLGWQWIFYINLPVGILAMFLMWRIYRPETAEGRPPANAKFDTIGLGLSMAGVIAVVYGFTVVSQRNPDTKTATNPQGDIYGWTSPLVFLLVGIGIALLIAFTIYELRAKDPVMDLRMFKHRDFASASFMTWMLRAFIFGSFFLLPFFLETIRNPRLGATDAGLSTMPMGLAAAVAVILGSRLYNKIGPRNLIMIGMFSLIVSNFLLQNITNETDVWSLVPAMILRGFGFGSTGFPLQTLALAAITGRALPKASSLYNVTSQIFSSIGIAVLSTLFVQQTTVHLPPPAQIEQIRTSVQQQLIPNFLTAHPGLTQATIQSSPDFAALQKQIGDAVSARIVSTAGVPALNDVFFIVTIAMVVLFFLSFFVLPNKIPQKASGDPAESQSEHRPAVAVE